MRHVEKKGAHAGAEAAPGAAADRAAPSTTPRKAPRHTLQCRIFFAAGTLEGEGTVYNLSKTGCHVRCETTVQPGMDLALSFFIPDYGWPLRVDHAIVRWARGEDFGVEFVEMQPTQRERLRLFLTTQK